MRRERPEDARAVYDVNALAFGRPDEARLVDKLRGADALLCSWVAENAAQEVVGHIAYSRVLLGELAVAGLAPMAVTPSLQRRGVGSALVDVSLRELRNLTDAVVVLGHPTFYPRFGFQPASTFGVSCTYDVPDEAFMALEFRAGVLVPGVAHYHEAFG